MAEDSGGREAGSRRASIDYLKAIAILAVVFHHSGPHETVSQLETQLRSLFVAFNVPVFLFASGFLYSRSTPVGGALLGRRCMRALTPYLIASCLVWLLRLRESADLADVAYRLATGSALGIYYYVFVHVTCIPLIWPLSRLSRRGVLLAAVCAHAYPTLAWWLPAINLETGLFWGMRNPLNYYWAYFLTGWVAAAYTPEIARLRSRFEPLLWCAALAGIVLWMVNGGFWLGWRLLPNGRAVYSLSIVLLVTLALGGRSAPRPIVFLSQASFSIYLYHLFFVQPLMPRLAAWPWGLRSAVLVIAGVAGSALIVVVARRLSGPRSRLLVGA